MATPKKAPTAKAATAKAQVTVKDLKPNKNPKGGIIFVGGKKV